MIKTQKKITYPIGSVLRDYLKTFNREIALPLQYDDLLRFQDSVPLLDEQGNDTLWETVFYPPEVYQKLEEWLRSIYVFMKTAGRSRSFEHLHLDRIDYCTFGNSKPFRIRIVNQHNDNQDYYYIKRADASRVHGLELEDLLSPNRLHYLTAEQTLIEEHIIGVPGDMFMDTWLDKIDVNPVRLGKELVKFNERCFVRLLGDMRSYNYVFNISPDFEDTQITVRAMDFDQQSYSKRMNFYRPQFFIDNNPLFDYCKDSLDTRSIEQYKQEEYAALYRRIKTAQNRINSLLDAMRQEPIAPSNHVETLSTDLAEHYQDKRFTQAYGMSDLVHLSLDRIRERIG